MAQFQVRSEHLPSRCEICHQSDRFDPGTGSCDRCEGVIPESLASPRPVGTLAVPSFLQPARQSPVRSFFERFDALVFLACGLFVPFFLTFQVPKPGSLNVLADDRVRVRSFWEPGQGVAPPFLWQHSGTSSVTLGNLSQNPGEPLREVNGLVVSTDFGEFFEGRFEISTREGERAVCFTPPIWTLTPEETRVLRDRFRPGRVLTVWAQISREGFFASQVTFYEDDQGWLNRIRNP